MRGGRFLGAGLLAVAGAAAAGPPPFSGTGFLDPDIIRASDPTTFVGITPRGQGVRTMFDRRVNAFIPVNAYLYDAAYTDGDRVEVQVNPEFGAAQAALEAEQYARVAGRLPRTLRRDVDTMWIHAGDQPFGGGNRNLLIHTGSLAQGYIAQGVLEEILAHEASHTSLDADHAASSGWLAAQQSDGRFISTYARDFPTQEDVAETLVAWLAVRIARPRIDAGVAQQIDTTVPARLAYLDGIGFDMAPLGDSQLIFRDGFE